MPYTREQIGQALQAAHEAGDVEAAQQLAVAYRDWKPSTPDPVMNRASERANMAFRANEKIAPSDLTQLGKLDFSPAAMGRLAAPTMSEPELDAFDAQRAREKELLHNPDSDLKERLVIGSNVGTFGHGPQAMAAGSTIGALLATPFIEGDIIDREGVSGAMSSFLGDAREHQRRAREERPLESLGIEVGGALIQGKTLVDGLGKAVFTKPGALNNTARFATTGAGYGALYGFGQSEADSLEGALGDAAFGGGLGAGFGVGAKVLQAPATVAVRGVKSTGAEIYDAFASLLGRAGGARDKVAEDVAIAAVKRSADRSGMTVEQMFDLVEKYKDKPAVLAEVIGEDAINALTALANRKGSTPQKALEIGEERAFGRPDRMRGDIEDATGIAAGKLDETLDTQLGERQEAAKPVYEALYKRFNTIKSFGESLKRINRLGRTPAMQKHLQLAKEAVATQAALREIPISKMSKMEYWDLVKRSLDDEINSAVAKGETRTKVGASVADLTQLKKGITDEFDRLTDGAYAAARQAGGEAPRLREAATAGQKAFQARNPREVARTVAATLSQDLPALQAGMVDDLTTRIDKGTLLPSRFRRPDAAGKVRAVFGDEVGGKIISKMDAEAQLASSGAKWAPRVGPKTSIVTENGPGGMADDLMNMGVNLATGNKLGLFRQAMNFMRQRGFSQRQINAIGDLLLSSPEEGLRRLKIMRPDGAPANAFAPLTGGGGSIGGGPPSGGSPIPTPAEAGPIRAGGFPGFGGKKPRLEDTKTIPEAAAVLSERFKPRKITRAATQDDWDEASEEAFNLLKARAAKQDGFEPGARVWQEKAPDSLTDPKAPPRLVFEDLAEAILRSRGIDPDPVYGRMLAERPTNAETDVFRKTAGHYAGKARAKEREGMALDEMDDTDAAIEQMSNIKPPSRLNGIGAGLRTDLGSGVGGAVFAGAMPMDADATLQDRLNRAGTGFALGYGASKGGRIAARMRDGNAFAGKTATAGAPNKIGARTADAAAIAALGISPTAEAQTGDGSAEVQAANERINELATFEANAQQKIGNAEQELKAFQGMSVAEKQRFLRDNGFTGPNGEILEDDGATGGLTTYAINRYTDKVRGAISEGTRELSTVRGEMDKAQQAALKAERQAKLKAMQAKNQPNMALDIASKAAMLAGLAGGVYLAKRGRSGAVAKSAPAAKAAAAKANALLNSKRMTSAKTGPDSLNQRAANINAFWKQGGAGDKVPFKVDGQGNWTDRPGAMEPAQLFSPKWHQQYRNDDVLYMVTAAVDVGGSRAGINYLNDEIKKVDAEYKAYEAQDDFESMDRKLAEKTRLEGLRTALQITEKVGGGYLLGRAVGSPLMPYAKVNANVKAAEAQRASLLQKMNPPQKPRPASNNQGQGNP
jgi:hypothetical protein